MLMSACMGNVFLKTGGVWATPSTSYGARAGVVREWVMERLPTRQTSVSRAMLSHCEAMFITSSWLGIMPVQSLDGRLLETQEAETVRLRFDWEQTAH
jgi:branched-subunit amino acid aminotransferase/4-amino-4-deoxychorismate lyase